MIQLNNNNYIESGNDFVVLNKDIIKESSSYYNFYGDQFCYRESQKIKDFNLLKEGWHFGEGRPINKEIIEKALALDRKAYECGYFETDAFPGVDGEIAFTIYYKDDYFEFMIEKNGMINFIHEYKDKDIHYESNISLEKAIQKIDMLKEEICTSSEFSILDIGIIEREDLTELPLKTPVIASQLYPKNVFFKMEEEFASISNCFMDNLQDYPLFFGDSPYKTYPTPVK